jgi:hypothetical protein
MKIKNEKNGIVNYTVENLLLPGVSKKNTVSYFYDDIKHTDIRQK